jgi:hypothetical protein
VTAARDPQRSFAQVLGCKRQSYNPSQVVSGAFVRFYKMGSVFVKSAPNAAPLPRYMSVDIAGNHFLYLAGAARPVVYQPTRARCQRTGWQLHFERFLGLG